jgi:hypothetical protein
MAYTDEETFNLAPVHAEDLYVTYKRPGMMPWEESRRFFSTHAKFKTKQRISVEQSIEDVLNDTEHEMQWILTLITDWNLTDRDTGEILPLPSKDTNTMKRVRSMYLPFIVKTIKDDPSGVDFLTQDYRKL